MLVTKPGHRRVGPAVTSSFQKLMEMVKGGCGVAVVMMMVMMMMMMMMMMMIMMMELMMVMISRGLEVGGWIESPVSF